jgi:hypothetical protein
MPSKIQVILALSTFYQITKLKPYLVQMKTAFDWYLGNNTLNQIVYNPISGGCLDGLEANKEKYKCLVQISALTPKIYHSNSIANQRHLTRF